MHTFSFLVLTTAAAPPWSVVITAAWFVKAEHELNIIVKQQDRGNYICSSKEKYIYL